MSILIVQPRKYTECQSVKYWGCGWAVKSLGIPGGREHDSMNLLGGHARGQKPVKTAGTASVLVSSFSMFWIMFSLTSHWPERLLWGTEYDLGWGHCTSAELAHPLDLLSYWDGGGHWRPCLCAANSQPYRKQHRQSLPFLWRMQSIISSESFPLRTKNCGELWETHYNTEILMWKNERNKIVHSLKRKIREQQHQHEFNYEALFSP